MTLPDHVTLTRLLQLASPALPVGAYSYSQGLEAAIDAGIVRDEATTLGWIVDVLELTVSRMEAPLFLRLHRAWTADDEAAARGWNDRLLASRETAELRAETAQMGYSLARLLTALREPHPFEAWEDVSMPAVYTWWAARCDIDASSALVAYLWSWAENQVMAALKAVPLGQSAGQRVLFALGSCIAEHAARAKAVDDDSLGGLAPAFAILSSRHETQYSRLFRS
ncbi:MAG: urease accessory protein UreF [Betaproteobacteria bacterium]|nr:urease accessory protein UreF [Betaproteobacteria bacterium]